MKRLFGKTSVALAAGITILLGAVGYGFTTVNKAETNSVAYLYTASAEEIQHAVGPSRFQDPRNGTWFFNDFLLDGDVTADNDTDFGQSPLEYPNWVFTAVNDTIPLTATHADNGTLTVTNAGADNDGISAQGATEHVKFTDGRAYYIAGRFKLNPVTDEQCDFGFGVGIIDTDWLGDTDYLTDGLFIEVNDGDDDFDLIEAYNESAASGYTRASAMSNYADNTWFTLEMVVIMDGTTDGKGRILVWKDSVLIHDAYHTSICYDEELTPMFAFEAGEAAANVYDVDWIAVGADRS